MVMSEMTDYIILCISSINLLPNIVDLHQLEETSYHNIIDLREEYARILLLLFYPYCIQDGLKLNESYWDRYTLALSNNLILNKDMQVCQNIYVCHHCLKLKVSSDDLLKITTMVPHDNY